MAATRTRRVLSVLAATVVTATTATLPAVAQPESSQPSTPPAEEESFATPPPLAPNYPLPDANGQPDHDYQLAQACVTSREELETLESRPWGQDALQFDELERFATGKDQLVAVIDTGVTPHPYIADRLEAGPDYVDGAENGSLEDCDGHGTEVAGIIAADPNDPNIGFRGIAPDARILSIRQSSANYEYKDPNNSTAQAEKAGNLVTLAKAIINAADAGASVINMSVDSCRPVSQGPITEAEKTVHAAARYAVEQKDAVLVASAGNLDEGTCTEQNSPDPDNPTWVVSPPWFSEYVISVAAMTRQGQAAEFSIQGPWVSVAAPGTEIISLNPADGATGLANQTVDDQGKAQPIQGTSFAAPYVAGLAALIREEHPDLRAKQVMHRIKSTAVHPGAPGGHDNLVGYGMINPVTALTARIPAEHGEAPDEAIESPFTPPPPYERNWTPVQVAMIGSGGGLGLLLLTLFIVHTVRRNRRDPDELSRSRHRA